MSDNDREPVAWLVDGGEYQYVSLFRESADAAADEEGGTVTPLYRSPTLTDAERAAVQWYAGIEGAVRPAGARTTLRGLLERIETVEK